MSPEFRQEAHAVYQVALQIDPTKRSSFLDQACGKDSSLRSEVESLLSAHDLETVRPRSQPAKIPIEILGPRPANPIGQTIAHYKILSLLGRGGMGEVYLAHDTKLGRNVALKLLPRSFTADEERLKRFAREARSASALNHPNVCVIHEIGETEDGQPFIAMEHIEGVTLRERLKEQPIPVDDAVGIAEQVAGALMAAHKAGVVHRDIKPENIMLRPDGYVKVLDFGLAKLTEKYAQPGDSEAATLPVFDTASDHLIGTVYYLSPEQAKRQPVDERTDIWSLGVVLYEMLVGRKPFSGETPSHAIVAILESEPESLTKSLDGVPASLERIVGKALQKNRQNRYQTVTDLSVDLGRVKQELSTGSDPVVRRPRPKANWSFAIAAAMGVLAVTGVVYLLVRRQPTEPPPTTLNSVAVLPFLNSNSDPESEYLSDGMTDELIDSLSLIPNLKVTGRHSAFHYKGLQTDSRTVGTELGVQAILTGRVVAHDGSYSIYVDLEDTRDKHHIWGGHFERRAADLLANQDEIAQKITENLRLRISGEDQQRLARRPTENVQAYQLYLKGRWYWNKYTREGRDQAENSFQEAIRLDPNYALAYSGLADVYVNDATVPVRESCQKAREAAEKALALDNTLGEAHATLGYIKTHYDIDWPGAEAEFARAIELNPSYATAHQYYGELFLARGNFDKARQEFEKARELDPLSAPISADLGSVYFYQRDYDHCIEALTKISRQFPDFFIPHATAAWAYTQKQMYDQAISEYREADKLSNGHTYVQATLAYTYAKSGKKKEARKLLKDLETRAAHQHISPMRFVIIHLGLGDKNEVFQWLERAKEELDVYLIYIRINPFFDSVKDDPRFQDFIRRLGLASA